MLEEKAQDLMINVRGLLPLIISNALNVLGAIVILLIGLWLAGKADQLVVRMLNRAPHFDAMLKSFFGSLARYLVLTVTVLAVLSQFGIQTTSLIAVLGAAGLAVGLALQGTLSNLAAGVMLLIFRPFRIGHKVQIGGNIGTVKELSLFWTELVSDDEVQIIVPMAVSGAKPCVTSAFIRRRHTPARCASGYPKGSSLIGQSRRCARSSKPTRVCSLTRLPACCSITARTTAQSR
jgi:small-conductance mechanosensitive channel